MLFRSVDVLAGKFVDRIGYKPCIIAAHLAALAGLVERQPVAVCNTQKNRRSPDVRVDEHLRAGN